MIPDWLAMDNMPLPQADGVQGGWNGTARGSVDHSILAGCRCKALTAGRKGFVERTIDGAVGFLRNAILSETIAKKRGLLQTLDPRIKLVTILALIVSVSLMRFPATIWGMYLFTLLLAVASSVPLWFFVKRVWLFIPIFSAVIIAPALFNVVTPGETLWTIFHLGRSHDFGPYHIPDTLAITRQGVLTATTFLGRVAASVSLAVLLTLTTRWNDLLRALGVLGVPRIFVLLLSMAYRYIILLVNALHSIHIARKSRTLSYGETRAEQLWVASRMVYLFRKTHMMSQDVHKAMLSRGFSGDIKVLSVFKTKSSDFAWCFFVAVFCAVALLLEHGVLHCL